VGKRQLYTAGNLATNEDADQVTENHVRRAEDKIQQGAIVTEVSQLSTQGKIITLTLVRMHEEGELPSKLDKIYAWYETHANKIDADIVTPRTVSNTLNDLMLNGVVTTKEVNRGMRGGRFYRYDLGPNRDLLLEGLRGDARIADADTRNRLDIQRDS
jgi:cell division control protein 6